MKLTLYMFKPHVQKFSEGLRPQSEARKYRDITSQAKREADPNIRIYALEKEPKMPSWSNFVAGLADIKEVEAMRSQSAAVLIMFRVETIDGPRIFAASYGSAFSLIETSLIESNFGLKTTINTISPSKIKNIDYKNISSRSVGKKESAKRAAAIANFAFDHESESLKSISGSSIDHDLGASISGGASLKISIPDLQPEQLTTIGQKAYDRYMQNTYKEHFDFIDHFEQEKDILKIADLDNQLLLALNQATPPERLFLAYPDQISTGESSYFRLTVNNTSENFDDIEVENLHTFLQGNASQLDIDTLKSDAFVTGLDDNEEAVTPRKSIYTMLVFETTFEDSFYVLSDSKWYKIGTDFLENLNDWLSKNLKTSTIKSKSWFKTQSEWDFCEQYKGDEDTIVLSRKVYRPKRHAELFMADLYHKPSNSLIFVKRLNSGTSFSHMLDQATTTADLLREDDPHAWKFLQSHINEKWPEVSKKAIATGLNVVLIINDDREVPQNLPVFSKIALKKAQKTIKKLQIEVSLLPVKTGVTD